MMNADRQALAKVVWIVVMPSPSRITTRTYSVRGLDKPQISWQNPQCPSSRWWLRWGYTWLDDEMSLLLPEGSVAKPRLQRGLPNGGLQDSDGAKITPRKEAVRRPADEIADLLYAELRALARAHLGRERRGHTLQATEIVHIAYQRLVKITNLDVSDRTKFLALAAQMIRRILVDHARARKAGTRPSSGNRITLSGIETSSANGGSGEVDVLALHEALEELARLDERQARVIEMLYFAGMNQQEAADLLGVSLRTVQGDSKMARAWLKRRLG